MQTLVCGLCLFFWVFSLLCAGLVETKETRMTWTLTVFCTIQGNWFLGCLDGHKVTRSTLMRSNKRTCALKPKWGICVLIIVLHTGRFSMWTCCTLNHCEALALSLSTALNIPFTHASISHLCLFFLIMLLSFCCDYFWCDFTPVVFVTSIFTLCQFMLCHWVWVKQAAPAHCFIIIYPLTTSSHGKLAVQSSRHLNTTYLFLSPSLRSNDHW